MKRKICLKCKGDGFIHLDSCDSVTRISGQIHPNCTCHLDGKIRYGSCFLGDDTRPPNLCTSCQGTGQRGRHNGSLPKLVPTNRPTSLPPKPVDFTKIALPKIKGIFPQLSISDVLEVQSMKNVEILRDFNFNVVLADTTK